MAYGIQKSRMAGQNLLGRKIFSAGSQGRELGTTEFPLKVQFPLVYKSFISLINAMVIITRLYLVQTTGK